MSLPDLPPGLPSREEAEQQFAATFTSALADATPQWANRTLQPPVAAAVPFLRSAVSNALGLGGDFSAVVQAVDAGALGPGGAATIGQAVAGLVTGVVQAAVELGGAGASTIAGVAESVPVLGAVVGTVVTNIVRGVTAEAMLDVLGAEAERQLHQELAQYCAAKLAETQPWAPTSDVSPADFFRRLAFAHVAWRQNRGQQGLRPLSLPLDVASMYLLLCGGETQGFSLLTRERYQQLLAQARSRRPTLGGGIPAADQRRMWRIIQAIMSTSGNVLTSQPIGDRGYALFPVLQDITNQYYYAAVEDGKPGWDDYLASLLSDEIARNYRHHVIVRESGVDGAGTIYRESSCAGQEHGYGRHVDLGKWLVMVSAGYQHALEEEFKVAGKWKTKPRASIGTAEPQAVLVFEDARELAREIETAAAAKRSMLAKGAIALASGVGAYWAARRWL